MVLTDHYNAGYQSSSQAQSQADALIMLSEDNSIPCHNGPVLTVENIINFFISSATKAKLTTILITSKEMVPLQQTLIKMVWPRPPSPLQTYNFTACGIVNKTIIPKHTKSMDMGYYWVHCHEAQDQFCTYWDKDGNNNGEYSTKHHPPTYHEAQCPNQLV